MSDITQSYFTQSKLIDFNQLEEKVPGFLTSQNAALWDSLLSYQAEQYILGNMLEIGVYKGRSALMSSLHLREKEIFSD
jgi:hypothetical protein